MDFQFKGGGFLILVPMQRGNACMARQPMLCEALDRAAT